MERSEGRSGGFKDYSPNRNRQQQKPNDQITFFVDVPKEEVGGDVRLLSRAYPSVKPIGWADSPVSAGGGPVFVLTASFLRWHGSSAVGEPTVSAVRDSNGFL